MQLAGVLDQNHPVVSDLGQQGVGERGLAGTGAARHQDIPPVTHRLLQGVGLDRHHDVIGHVVGQGVDLGRRLADGEARRQRHRWQQALEAFAPVARAAPAARAARGQFGTDDGIVGMDFGADMRSDETDDPLGFRRSQGQAGIHPPLAQPVETQTSVGIDHHLDNQRIGQRRRDNRTHGSAQHGATTIIGFRVGDHDGSPGSSPVSVRRRPAICRPT